MPPVALLSVAIFAPVTVLSASTTILLVFGSIDHAVPGTEAESRRVFAPAFSAVMLLCTTLATAPLAVTLLAASSDSTFMTRWPFALSRYQPAPLSPRSAFRDAASCVAEWALSVFGAAGWSVLALALGSRIAAAATAATPAAAMAPVRRRLFTCRWLNSLTSRDAQERGTRGAAVRRVSTRVLLPLSPT